MRIGIVGAGMIGRTLAVRSGGRATRVMLSNSRGPETLAEVVGSIQGIARAGTVAEAARFGRVVAVAIPVQAVRTVPPEGFAIERAFLSERNGLKICARPAIREFAPWV